MFKKILIARRGEAAVRVARTCRHLGITAIALYTDDEGAADSEENSKVQVEACDVAVRVTAGEDGHLDPATVVAVAREHGVDAVHPGYRSHTAHLPLAHALEAEGLPFIGADPDVLSMVSQRVAIRAAAERADVRMVPGTASPVSSLADAYEQAEAAGYPVVLRATKSDSGFPLSTAEDDEELEAIWDSRALQDAVASGVQLCVERRIERPRIIETLLAADSTGEVIPLCDRELSIVGEGGQLIEESPCPELGNRADGEAIRQAMFDSAIRLAREINCIGLLSVEFLLDVDTRLWISGARIGLPRHHSIPELVTNLDLVELQLRLASGENLPDEVLLLQPHGHAIGAWLRATDPATRTQQVTEVAFPPGPQRKVRIEPSAAEGSAVPADDWPILAKLACFAPIRHQALLTLDRILAEHRIEPMATNAGLLREVLGSETFRAGQYDRDFVSLHTGT